MSWTEINASLPPLYLLLVAGIVCSIVGALFGQIARKGQLEFLAFLAGAGVVLVIFKCNDVDPWANWFFVLIFACACKNAAGPVDKGKK